MLDVASVSAPPWRTVLDALVGCSTIAIAAFAAVELYRAGVDRRARTEGANAKVSAIAFALLRQLRSWLRELDLSFVQEKLDKSFTVQKLKAIQAHFDTAEHRMQDMLATAVDATRDRQEALREAYVRFYRATDTINQILLFANTRGMTVLKEEWEKWPSYTNDIEACILMLQKTVADELANAQDRLSVETHPN